MRLKATRKPGCSRDWMNCTGHGELSERGSHANINAICDRFVTVENDGGDYEWQLRYCGIDERMWGMQLFWILLASFTMERTFFLAYESRLKFDDTLLKMRAEFLGPQGATAKRYDRPIQRAASCIGIAVKRG